MTVWDRIDQEVHERHHELASTPQRECARKIGTMLGDLAARGHCSSRARWQIDSKQQGRTNYTVSVGSGTGCVSGSHPCIELTGLDHLEDGARLSFQVDVITDRKTPSAQYTIGLVGKSRADGSPWFARIDLGPRGQGAGRCCHATLHGHVGQDPDSRFQARVPLPWLLPWEALEWLLATVHPGLEPCPHS